MKKDPDILAATLLGLAILTILFYLSPFSETMPAQVYENLEGWTETPQYPHTPLYGHPISGKYAEVYFPFRMMDNNATRFCLGNKEKIGELCGIRTDQVLLKEGEGFYHCTYVTLSNESGEVQNFVDVEKTSKDVSESGVATVSGTFWKSNLSNFSFKDTCTSPALAGIGS